MNGAVRSLRVLIGIAIALSFLFSAQAGQVAAASRYARITLHVSECPIDSANPYARCHDNRVEGFTFYIAGKAKITDANGVATGAPGAGRRTVRPNANDLAPYYIGAGGMAPSYVYCSDQVSGAVLANEHAYGGIVVNTTAGQPVICDWYLLVR